MWPDVLEMRKFYASSLGQVVQRILYRKIHEFWPTVRGQALLSLGYATPYLQDYRETAKDLVALMPAEQGALSWSQKQPNIVVLTEATLLPLADKSINCALLVHSLEFSDQPREILREIWRVLVDGGRLLVVVPNRLGLWSRLEKTPFGQGHTYSHSQLTRLLQEALFAVLKTDWALYIPPFQPRLWLGTAGAWETLGHQWMRHASGVILLEASKQVYAGRPYEENSWKGNLQVHKKLTISLK